MKQAVSPAVAVIVILIVVAVVAVAIWKFSSKGKVELKDADLPDMTMDPGAGKAEPVAPTGDPNNPAPPLMQQMQGSKGGK